MEIRQKKLSLKKSGLRKYTLLLLVFSVASVFFVGGVIVVWKAYARKNGVTSLDASKLRQLRVKAQLRQGG